MASPEIELKILVVDDDPSTARQVGRWFDDSGTRTTFADTPNAITRTLDSEFPNLALIHIHENTRAMLDPLVRSLRETDPPAPLVAMVGDDAESALAAAGAAVDGLARADDEVRLRRLLQGMLDNLRENARCKAALDQLADIEDRYNLLLESSSESIAYIHEGLHIYANPAYLKRFGYSSFDELEGLSILDLISSEDSDVDVKQLLRNLSKGKLPGEPLVATAHCADESTFDARVVFSPARYAGERCTQMMVREVAQADDSKLQQELEKLRTRDLLTGLLNRQSFLEQLAMDLEDEAGEGAVAVLLMTLDDHAGLQEKLGAGATDALIRQTADLFKSLVDEDMLPCRLRDHTMAVRCRVGERKEAEKLARHIVEGFSGHIMEVHEKSLTVTASVGLALGGLQSTSVDELIAQAETALTEAVRAGGSSYLRFRPRTDAGDGDDASHWAERLRHALNNDDFRLVEMPITSMEDDNLLIREVEARLRLEDSDEILLPQSYLPAAIQAGMGTDLDRDLLSRLAGHMAGIKDDDGSSWLVPLCASSITDEGFVDWLQKQIEEKRLHGNRLIIGLREPEARDNLRKVQKFLNRFAGRGVRFALCEVALDTKIDPLLKHIQVGYMKLLPETISALGGNEKARQALEALVRSAESNQIAVIAPRVEKTSDLAALWQFGITLVQDDFVREEADS